MSEVEFPKASHDEASSQRIWKIVALIGSLASLISIPLAIFFYAKSREYPELTYYTHPVKAELLLAGKVSKLKASFEDKSVETDVTTAQIALWNQGTRSIKSTEILSPIVISTDNGAPIFEASIRKVSRDVTHLKLGVDEISKGRLNVTWNILEPGDGAVLQIIYAGPAKIDFKIDGVIEGQQVIRQLRYRGKIQSPEEQYNAARNEIRKLIPVFLFMAACLIVLIFVFRRSIAKVKMQTPQTRVVMNLEEVEALIGGDSEKLKEFEDLKSAPRKTTKPLFVRLANIVTILGFIGVFLAIGVSVLLFMISREPAPPFGF